MAKVYGSESFADVADAGVQCFGGYGYIREYPVEGLYRNERIQRIYEGTNEINRMIIPGTFVRKAVGGELGLFEAAKQAGAAIASSKAAKPAGDGLFAAKYALIRNLRTVATAIYGLAAQTYQKKLANEQEILLALADISMQLFALESAVLRAEKVHAGASDAKRTNLEAVVKICAFDASEKFASAARRALSFIESDNSAALRMGILPFCIYNSYGLLQAKRTLAKAASESEKYLF
jgi:alkylation response protein AidB-like acyl-CoA dehydrogenase